MIAVLQVVDTLKLAGLESVAVNYSNLLAQRGVRSYLCSTRASGPLAANIDRGVGHLLLKRRKLIDLGGLKRFVQFIRLQQIDIIHAHGTSLFFSALGSMLTRTSKLIWHEHCGRSHAEHRPVGLYRLALIRAAGIIAVNEPLAKWARESLKVPADRVWYVPNFVQRPTRLGKSPQLPGTPGKRVVCVANLRPEKDHLTLVNAMKRVCEREPDATLFLVGDHANQSHAAKVKELVRLHNLQENVFLLGPRKDVWGILNECNVGVLSSASEGMPLALLEYGVSGLPAVATAVGQVPDVLAGGDAGLLVRPGQPAELAAAVIKLLQSPKLRETISRRLSQRIQANFSETVIMDEILRIYRTVLGPSAFGK